MKYSVKPLRITFLLPGYPTMPIGGFRIVYQYANEMVLRGHSVTVVHPLRVPPLQDHKRIFQTMNPGMLRRVWRKLRNYRIYLSKPSPRKWQAIDEKVKMVYHFETPSVHALPDADILIATAAGTVAFVEQAAQSKGEKFYFIQGFESVFGNSEEAVLRTWRADLKKIVISKWLMAIGKENNMSNIFYVPNAIDHELFKPNDALSLSNSPAGILSLWHDAKFKGSQDALDAIQIVHVKYPDLKVSFFGTRRRPELLPTWVHYFQNPTQSELVTIYNAHSVFVNASKSEGFGLTPMEAMACGCCFVGTNAGGFLDYAVNEENALLSPIGDTQILSENILRVIDSPVLLSRLVQRGRIDVQMFSWDKSAKAFECIIRGHGV